jgi:aminopeptidase N
MKKHAYGNAVTSDLWREIEAAGGKGVTGIARDFTVQPGVPLVTVTGVKCINGQSKVDVTLGRFALQPILTPAPVWSVPITLRAGDASPTKVTTRKATSITTPGCGPVIVNAGQNSYFVTVYDKAAFAGVVEAFAKASLEDQLGLLANADLAGAAGIKPVTDYLDLAHVAPVDADPLVWLNIMGQLRGFDHNYADGNPRQAKFRAFARSIAEPLFAKLGWDTREGDSANTIQLRQGLIWSLARFGNPDIIAGARARFDALVADPQSLKGDLRETVLRIVGYYADGPTFDRLAELANKTQSDLERRQFLGAIALVKDKAIAARARDYFLSPEVPTTAAPRLLATMAGNHPDETWAFGKQHWNDLKTRLDSLESLRYLPGLAAGSFDPAVIDDMRAFVKQNLPPEAEKAAGNTESSIRLNMRGRNEHVPEIDKWLDRVGN